MTETSDAANLTYTYINTSTSLHQVNAIINDLSNNVIKLDNMVTQLFNKLMLD